MASRQEFGKSALFPDLAAAQWIWVVASPILLVLGSVGNMLSIAVMMRRSLRETTARLLLIILAFADLLNLYAGLLRHWIRVAFGIDIRAVSNASCKIHIYVVYFATHFEAWILVIITIERFVAVFCPHKSKVLFTKERAALAIVIVAGVLLLINVHFFWTCYLVTDEYGGYCDYAPFFDTTWIWLDLFLASLGPFAVMITLNCAIVCKLHQHRTYRRRQCIRARASEIRQTRLTATLLMVTITFFLTTLPLCIHLILVNGVFRLESDAKTLAQISLSFAICSILSYTNNSVNFFLYCLGGNRFRRELVIMCRCKCCHRGVEPELTLTDDITLPSLQSGRVGTISEAITVSAAPRQFSSAVNCEKLEGKKSAGFEQTTITEIFTSTTNNATVFPMADEAEVSERYLRTKADRCSSFNQPAARNRIIEPKCQASGEKLETMPSGNEATMGNNLSFVLPQVAD